MIASEPTNWLASVKKGYQQAMFAAGGVKSVLISKPTMKLHGSTNKQLRSDSAGDDGCHLVIWMMNLASCKFFAPDTNGTYIICQIGRV